MSQNIAPMSFCDLPYIDPKDDDSFFSRFIPASLKCSAMLFLCFRKGRTFERFCGIVFLRECY